MLTVHNNGFHFDIFIHVYNFSQTQSPSLVPLSLSMEHFVQQKSKWTSKWWLMSKSVEVKFFVVENAYNPSTKDTEAE